MSHKENHSRSIAKTISWRIIATVTTVSIVYVATGDLTLSLEVGLVEVFAKLILYYIHERTWSKVRWGKTKAKQEINQ